MDLVDGLYTHEQVAPVSTNRCDLLVRRWDGGAKAGAGACMGESLRR